MSKFTEEARILLIKNGYNSLMYPGECACSVDDFAPCGECEKADGEEYINGCEPGYKHVDPENKHFWIVKANEVAPTDAEWKQLRAE